MAEKTGRSIWDFITENPRISFAGLVFLSISMFFLIRGYNVKTPHITIESKDKQMLIEKKSLNLLIEARG